MYSFILRMGIVVFILLKKWEVWYMVFGMNFWIKLR